VTPENIVLTRQKDFSYRLVRRFDSLEGDMKKETFVPYEFIENAAMELSDYFVSFVKLEQTSTQEYARLAGSGTLVEIEGTHAILTADHVFDDLPRRSGNVGLVLATRFQPQLHRFTINMEHVEKLRVARGTCESDGPDLALLILDRSQLGSIKAMKSFYNLSKRRDQILSNPPATDVGVWLLSGMAEEWTSNTTPEKGYEIVKVFRGMHGIGLVEVEYMLNGYDCLEFKAKYNENYEGPRSYGGYSGGGLWHLLIAKREDGDIEVTDRILSGVAFYESPIEDQIRKIKCNGRQSIYRNVINNIRQRRS